MNERWHGCDRGSWLPAGTVLWYHDYVGHWLLAQALFGYSRFRLGAIEHHKTRRNHAASGWHGAFIRPPSSRMVVELVYFLVGVGLACLILKHRSTVAHREWCCVEVVVQV